MFRYEIREISSETNSDWLVVESDSIDDILHEYKEYCALSTSNTCTILLIRVDEETGETQTLRTATFIDAWQ